LTHAYATSIHKAQGSDYPIVIIPMLGCFKRMLRRNILYTGITRAIKEVIIVGSKAATAQAIHNNNTAKRNTRFAFRLRLLMKEMQQEPRKSA
jgi:exodeoxyribonuclease V alpha subunit